MTVRPFIAMTRRTFLISLIGVPLTATRVAASEHGFVLNEARMTDAGDEGTYALGQELAVIAKPNSTAQRQIDPMVNQDVDLAILPSQKK